MLSLSLSLTFSLSHRSFFFSPDDVIFMLSQTSAGCRGRGLGWFPVRITRGRERERVRKGGGREQNREKRRLRTCLVSVMKSRATGPEMLSEGPAVSVLAGDSLC